MGRLELGPEDKSGEDELRTTGTLVDKVGRKCSYLLTQNHRSHDWFVFDGDWRIGYAWCSQIGPDFRVSDFKFSPDFRRPRSFLGWPIGRAPALNYQRRGLGTALLRLILAHARGRGCRRIVGVISQVDLDQFPALPEWYARFGFRYSPIPEGGIIKGNLELPL